jgi:transposase
MYEELYDKLEPMVRGILKARRLRVDNFEDFVQEVRIRIYKRGIRTGVSEMDAVAEHVMWTHKSYKGRKRKLTEHQIPDTMDLSEEDSGTRMIEVADEIESLVSLTRGSLFTKEERFVFDTMLEGGYTIDAIGKMFNPPVSRQYIWQIKKSLGRKIRELKWNY